MNSPIRIKMIHAKSTHHRFLNFNSLNLKLLIVIRIHLIIAQTHSKIMKVLNIASHVDGKEASNTHNKI